MPYIADTFRKAKPKKGTFNQQTRDRIEALSIELEEAFNWDETKDGATFWSDVEDRLLRISVEGR